MSEYIVYESESVEVTDYLGDRHRVYHHEKREEIVRCRDCKHAHHDPAWQPDRRFKPVDLWSCHAEWCEGFEGDHPVVEPDGFCKWGERK